MVKAPPIFHVIDEFYYCFWTYHTNQKATAISVDLLKCMSFPMRWIEEVSVRSLIVLMERFKEISKIEEERRINLENRLARE